jgi:hypothetical protein
MKLLSIIALAALLFTFGCKEKDPVKPDRGRSFLHILGAVDEDSTRVTLDYYNANDVVIDDFFYHRNFPIRGYADLEAGGAPDEFGNGKLFVSLNKQPFANIVEDTLMVPRAIELVRDEKATICFVDSFGTTVLLKLKDTPAVPDADFAQVRFLNLSSANATASLTTSGGLFNIGGIPFMGNSDFMAVPDGQVDVEVRDAGGNVLATLPIFINGYTTYTFYVSGTATPELQYFTH